MSRSKDDICAILQRPRDQSPGNGAHRGINAWTNQSQLILYPGASMRSECTLRVLNNMSFHLHHKFEFASSNSLSVLGVPSSTSSGRPFPSAKVSRRDHSKTRWARSSVRPRDHAVLTGKRCYRLRPRPAANTAKLMKPQMREWQVESPRTNDTSLGCPAANVRVELQQLQSNEWRRVSEGRTNADGRVATHLVPEASVFLAGTYRMVFYTQEYFETNGIVEFFYPEVTIAFIVKDPTQHYHVPLLINPFWYSTYRGS